MKCIHSSFNIWSVNLKHIFRHFQVYYVSSANSSAHFLVVAWVTAQLLSSPSRLTSQQQHAGLPTNVVLGKKMTIIES